MFKKIVNTITLICFLGTSLVIPTGQAFAATPSIIDEGWETVVRVQLTGKEKSGEYSMQIQQGENWVSLNNEAPALLEGMATAGNEFLGSNGDITSDQVADTMYQMADGQAVVLGRYFPTTADLRIDLVKVSKSADGWVTVYRKQFRPISDGARWAKAGTYATPAEKKLAYDQGGDMGPNPFTHFDTGNSGIFHHISFPSTLVAVGHAARAYNAKIAYVAYPDIRRVVKKKKSGGLFKKKITIKVWDYVKPKWFVGLPASLDIIPDDTSSDAAIRKNMNLSEISGGYCLTGSGTCGSDPSKFVEAGMSFVSFDEGNMPHNEYVGFYHKKSKSGFTLFAMAVFAGIVSFALAPMMSAMMSNLAQAFTGAINSALTSMASTSALMQGLQSFALKLIMGGLSGIGPGDVVTGGFLSTQKDKNFGNIPQDYLALNENTITYMNTIGNGTFYPPPTKGDEWDGTPSINATFVLAATQNMEGGEGAAQGNHNGGLNRLWHGTCNVTLAAKECIANGQEPGVIRRKDSFEYGDNNMARRWNGLESDDSVPIPANP